MTSRAQTVLSTAVLGALVLGGLSLAGLSALLLTVEFDEAWILASAQRIADPAQVPQPPTTLTTGGVHMLWIAAASALGMDPVWAGRGMSLVFLVLNLLLIDRLVRRWQMDAAGRLMVLCFALAAPGSLFLSGMGFGVLPASFFFLLAFSLWLREDQRGWRLSVGVGLCLGLAMATRWTFVPLLPLFVLASLLEPTDRWRRFGQALIASLVAVAVFGALVQLYILLAPAAGGDDAQTVAANVGSAGAANPLPSPSRLISFAVKFFELIPLPVSLGLFCAVWFNLIPLPEPLRRFARLATLAALGLALAWAVRSPFLHTRYIWPALFLLFITGGALLAQLHLWARAQGQQALALLCIIITLGVCAQSYVTTVRLAFAGAALQTNTAGKEGLEQHFTPLKLIAEQRQIVAYLRTTLGPQDQVLGLAIPPEFAPMQLALQSQRTILPLYDWPAGKRPDRILVHDFSQIDARGQGWLTDNATLEATIGGYHVFLPNPDAEAPDPAILSRADIYRFRLPRAQSMTGVIE